MEKAIYRSCFGLPLTISVSAKSSSLTIKAFSSTKRLLISPTRVETLDRRVVMKSNRPRSLDLSSWSVTSMASGASSQTSSSGSQVESGGGDDYNSGSDDHARLTTNKT